MPSQQQFTFKLLRWCARGALTACVSLASALAITPADPNASTKARQILQYLQNLEGANQTLAAQQIGQPWDLNDTSSKPQGESEIARVYNLTGKYPAMIGLDWINCSVYPERATSTINLAKNYNNAGGLITFCWHGANPRSYWCDAPSVSDNSWSSLSPGEWNDLLNHPNSALYINWNRHIDQAAGWLRQLQDAGVPVIWRPLHEGEGNWFWWGNNPEGYKALWRRMFDRLTYTHGLHNLLWVFSSGPNSAYYPGNAYVDVAGRDIYSGNRFAAEYRDTYSGLKSFVGDRPTALTEAGLLPDLNYMHDNARYTWVLIWWGKYLDRDYYGEGWNQDLNNGSIIEGFYNDWRTVDRSEIQLPPLNSNLASGRSYLLRSRNSGKCAEVGGAAVGNGGNVSLFQIWNPAHTCQRWTAYDLGDGFWKFINVNSGRCLEVAGMNNGAGGNIQQWDWVNNLYQQWRLSDAGGGFWKLVNRGSGLLMDVEGGSGATGNGTNISQYYDVGGWNQHWAFDEVSPLPNDWVYSVHALHSNQCVDVEAGSTADGANISQYPYTGVNWQKWKVREVGGGFVRLINVHTGKAVEVTGFNTNAGGNICQWQEFPHDFQQWKLEGTDGGNAYRLVNRGSNFVMEVVNSSTANSANIAQWFWNGGNQQKWKFIGR